MKRTLLAIGVIMVLSVPALAGRAGPCANHPEDPRCQTSTTTTLPPTTTTTAPPTTTTTDPSTTTTTVPTTTTTTIVMVGQDIAGIGCSNTLQTINAYLSQSSEDSIIGVAAGGHTIGDWANKRDWDSRYLGFRPSTGYTGAWLQLCERASAGLTLENIETILANIWESDPGIPVWISPLNFYVDETCAVTAGNLIPNVGAVFADLLTATNPLVHRGPDLGPLSDNQLRRDDCHPNSAGENLLGGQMVGFFDE